MRVRRGQGRTRDRVGSRDKATTVGGGGRSPPKRRRSAATAEGDRVPGPARRRRDADGLRGRPPLRSGRRPLRLGQRDRPPGADRDRPGERARPARRARCARAAGSLWERRLPSPNFGCATVSNDVVFTSTYAGRISAYADRGRGAPLDRPVARWPERLPRRRRATCCSSGPACGCRVGRKSTPELVGFGLRERLKPTRRSGIVDLSHESDRGGSICAAPFFPCFSSWG